MKLKLKGGGYVDPDSKLENRAHVLKVGFENLFFNINNVCYIEDGMLY